MFKKRLGNDLPLVQELLNIVISAVFTLGNLETSLKVSTVIN